ncbi:MAG: CDP-diacylglycerol---serine O-phosphatidyltransferase [Pyrinomonadaceae bacterium]|jgi:CDP-diacylglycerol--serine O-phosphatidyltransferase|nr:CDP-diacylglycerol---serine O-phosphatidyltransferase [Pyrinomonadaceae bacterium]
MSTEPEELGDAHATEPQKERRGIRKGLYLIPSAFTAANIGMGYFAVMGALRGFQLLEGGTEAELIQATSHFDNASRAIGWAVVFDALDGRIARLTKTTTEIGVQLDSIADVVTFGIAPAVLAYAWGYGSAFAEGSSAHKLGWFISFMFLICGAFRLARFNVQATRPRVLAEGLVKVDKKNFVGLPIPMAGGFIAALVHFSPAPLSFHGVERGAIYSGLLMGAIALLSVLMVSTVRYTSFKTVGVGRRSTRLAVLAIAASGMLVWLYSRYVLVSIVGAYILYGVLGRLAGLFRHRGAGQN